MYFKKSDLKYQIFYIKLKMKYNYYYEDKLL